MSLVETPIQLPDGGSRIFYSRDDTSDPHMMKQAFVDDAFNLGRLSRWPEIAAWLKGQPRPLIIDAGGNIGTAAVWFAVAFPTAKVISIEPEAGNFALLQKNTAGLNVECLNKALCHPAASESIPLFAGASNAAFSTHHRTAEPVGYAETVSVFNLLDPSRQPFLIKIDIEGAEDNLFWTTTSWIDKFPLLMLEPHDWLYPKQRVSRNFLRAIVEKDRDFVIQGEHIVSIRNEL